MSLTHFSSNLPETLWWTQSQNQHNPYPIMDSHYHHHHHQPPSSTYNFTKQESDQDSTTTTTDHMSKEPMFEKPLTPSDVGKLNRLVIPKQHAEKYFPLGGCSDKGVCFSADPSLTPTEQQQKGLLLCFEDESGKPWRFRYSYWNSSQSYVLTKGWSRYVKEKRLDAGDVVLFEKHRFDGDRFFIGWRRRQVVQDSLAVAPPVGVGGAQVSNGWTTTRGFYDAHVNSYPSHHPALSLHHHPYQPDCLHAGSINDNQRGGDMVATTSGNPRRVRLFGVNLECPDDSEPSIPDGSSRSGLGLPHYQYFPNSNNMDINFSQMRYHQHQG